MRRYPTAAYNQLFPNGACVADFLPFDPAEDGDHYRPEPHFFEWWYFDVAFDDGTYLVAIFHSSLYNAVDHKPTLDLRYYPPEGAPIVAIGRFDRAGRFDQGDYRAAPDHCRVQIGECLAVDEGDHYRLNLRHGSLAAELTFFPELPGWRAGTGHLFADAATGQHFDWIVPVPRARVTGKLTVAGESRRVSGIGYHDHNWGNMYLSSAFRRWTWGRVQAGDWTLLFGDVIGRVDAHGVTPHVTPFMLALNGEILLTTSHIHIEEDDFTRESHIGVDYFRRLRLTTQKKNGKISLVHLTLTARRAIEALSFAAPYPVLGRHPRLRGAAELAFYLAQGKPLVGRGAAKTLGKGSYLRWEADYQIECTLHSGTGNRESVARTATSGQTLYEMMFFS